MTEMKDSGIEWLGDIPSHWKIIKFKFVFSIIGGNGFNEKYQGQASGDYPFCKASDINGEEKYLTTAKNYVDEKLVQSESYKVVPKNSILVSKIGEALKKNHRKINLCPCIVDNNLEAFSLKVIANISFWYYLLKIVDMNWFDNGGTIPSVNNEKLKNFYFPLPPLAEQKKIADFLDKKCSAIDSALDTAKKLVEKLREYKKSLIIETVTKGLNPSAEMQDSGIEWLGDIPTHWKIGRLKYFVNFYNGDRTSKYPQPFEFVDNGVAFLTSHNLNKFCVDTSNCKFITKEKYNTLSGAKIQMNDIVFCLRGSIGKCSINKHLFEGTVASSLCTIRPNNINGVFLLYCLWSEIVERQTQIYMNGTCAANLSGENVANFIIPLPPMDEQKKIVDFLDRKCAAIDESICRREKLIEKLTEYKKSLIYEAVTGKMEV